MYKKNAWANYEETQLQEMEALSKRYIAFLNAGKTERECVTEAVKQAEAAGFRNLDEIVRAGG